MIRDLSSKHGSIEGERSIRVRPVKALLALTYRVYCRKPVSQGEKASSPNGAWRAPMDNLTSEQGLGVGRPFDRTECICNMSSVK